MMDEERREKGAVVGEQLRTYRRCGMSSSKITDATRSVIRILGRSFLTASKKA